MGDDDESVQYSIQEEEEEPLNKELDKRRKGKSPKDSEKDGESVKSLGSLKSVRSDEESAQYSIQEEEEEPLNKELDNRDKGGKSKSSIGSIGSENSSMVSNSNETLKSSSSQASNYSSFFNAGGSSSTIENEGDDYLPEMSPPKGSSFAKDKEDDQNDENDDFEPHIDSVPSAIEDDKKVFRSYLDSSGVLDALLKVMVIIYENPQSIGSGHKGDRKNKSALDQDLFNSTKTPSGELSLLSNSDPKQFLIDQLTLMLPMTEEFYKTAEELFEIQKKNAELEKENQILEQELNKMETKKMREEFQREMLSCLE